MNQQQYGDNPFASINAPQNGPGKQQTNLDDLLNPFAVLGLDAPNKGPVSFAPQGWASGAGSVSPVNAPQPGPQIGSAQSAFQAPGTFQPQAYASNTSPAFGAPAPQQTFGSNSPAFGAPMPQQQGGYISPAFGAPAQFGSTSPAFSAPAPQYGSTSPAFAAPIPQAPQPGFGGPAQDPYAFRPPQPGYGNGLAKPVVMDADLSLFSAGPSTKSPAQARSPAPPQQASSDFEDFGPSFGAAPAPAPKATAPAQENWGDDFGITWDSPRKEAPKEKPSASPAPSEETHTRSPERKEAAVAGDVKLEGDVLARISVRTLIVKEWKLTFWIITGGKLLLYRNKEDYLYNPVGVMVKKDVPLRDNLRCSEITCKPYKGYGDLYHFTLEEMLDYGPSLIAKFASTNSAEIRDLRAVIIQHIIAERKKRIGHLARPDGESRYTSGSPVPNNNNSDDKYAKWGTINN